LSILILFVVLTKTYTIDITKKCVVIVNYLLLLLLMIFWYKIPADGDNAETCRSRTI